VIDAREVTVACATSLEAHAARRELIGVRVVETGIGLKKLREELGDVVSSCGLAGGLRRETVGGTIIVPDWIRRPGGSTLYCDPELSAALLKAARDLGFQVLSGPLVTTTELVRGSERTRWANGGYAAVDMETGLLEAPRVAAVRVILDTPTRELSGEGMRPIRAMTKPWNWPELLWLARVAPERARTAARVVKAALG
jgi:hypothetical protein